jgi:hypothetical protein
MKGISGKDLDREVKIIFTAMFIILGAVCTLMTIDMWEVIGSPAAKLAFCLISTGCFVAATFVALSRA